MNENEFSVGRVKYKAVPSEDGCDGCVFDKTACPAGIGLFPSCNAKRRRDGADVIFIEDIQTNADRIRVMSSKELAGIMQCECPPGTECSRSIDYPCVTCWLNWLNAESQEPKVADE
jgi:hypothetical protein